MQSLVKLPTGYENWNKITSKYEIFAYSKPGLHSLLLEGWDNATWELKKEGSKKRTSKGYHPTAIQRSYAKALPADIYWNHHPRFFHFDENVLNYGCGKDEWEKVVNYDPYHPNEKIATHPLMRKYTPNTFREIHCHYVLCVVNKNEGYEILNDIHSLMSEPDSVAVISVRADL